jgi:hypothetical protein
MTDTIIGVGGAIIGVIIAGPITYFFSRKLIRESHLDDLATINITEFNKAAATFRSAFIKEQRFLSYDSLADRTGTNACDIIKAAINRHEIAMIRFKPFVCKAQLDDYEKAWNEYAGNSKHFEQYSGSNINIFEAQKRRALALSRIENLLKFADPKH